MPTLTATSKDLDKLFTLITSDDQKTREKAFSDRSLFVDMFKKKWPETDESLKQKMLSFAGSLEVEEGMWVLMEGLKSHLFPVREQAKASLEKMAKSVTAPFHDEKNFDHAMFMRSTLFAVTLFEEMKQTVVIEEIKFYFQLLLSTGERGSGFAWKFYMTAMKVPRNILIDLLKGFPEPLRLSFAYQYSLRPVSARLNHGPAIKSILQTIKDRNLVITFLSTLFNKEAKFDPLFRELADRLNIFDHVLNKELFEGSLENRLKAINIIGLYKTPSGISASGPLLYANEKNEVKIACLHMLLKLNISENPKLTKLLFTLLEEKDPTLVFNAFSVLVKSQVEGVEKAILPIVTTYPTLKKAIYECLNGLPQKVLGRVLKKIPGEFGQEARETILRLAIRHHPERMIRFFKQYEQISEGAIREGLQELRNRIEAIQKQEMDGFAREPLPLFKRENLENRGLFDRLANGRREKRIKMIPVSKTLENVHFQGETIGDMDLSNMHLSQVHFSGCELKEINFSGAKLENVSFEGCFLKSISLSQTFLNNVSFKNAWIDTLNAKHTIFDACSFQGAKIRISSFQSVTMNNTCLMNTWIRKTVFSESDLSGSNFSGADMALVHFLNVFLHHADFSGALLKYCEFSGMDIARIQGLNNRSLCEGSPALQQIHLPDGLFTEGKPKGNWFDLIVILNEINRNKDRFLNQNHRRFELAMDSFTANRREMFELIPLLIHIDFTPAPADSPEKKKSAGQTPFGIHSYYPGDHEKSLFNKYFSAEKVLFVKPDSSAIEGVYTIGSVGSIAQTLDSDIDYWVCFGEERFTEEAISALKEKLAAIEKWALDLFEQEIHFFVMDPKKVREDRFGGSDQESSGSAQGKILKEEFYRTMIRVAGKIPFWQVFPYWMDDKYYRFTWMMSSKLDTEYLDLGNVSVIPKGEYFGASVWQLFKSLKSPFKSVMKMALLEKYIMEETEGRLLCNQLKERWIKDDSITRRLDPYYLLFEEIIDFYKGLGQKEAESLVEKCFFLKVDPDQKKGSGESVLGIRKKMVDQCVADWKLERELVSDLKNFSAWPYEKIVQLGSDIKTYMLDTYKRLSNALKVSDHNETLITSQDLTILGRKMFVHFTKHPHKVETLSLVFHGGVLFQQVRLQYERSGSAQGVWELHHLKSDTWAKTIQMELIRKMNRVEEIAIWMVHNHLYLSSKSIQVMPNPTPVSPQDFLDLLEKLHQFFAAEIKDEATKDLLQKKPIVKKIFIIANFCLNRKLEKIFEYAVIYETSWGETYCRIFTSKNGFNSVQQIVDDLEKSLDISIESAEIGAFVSTQSRNRIKIGEGILS